jgi:pimeloyl-ACP methyl ester carboxylesterase
MLDEHAMLPAIRQRIGGVLATLKSGDAELGAKQFVENVALGPGMWEKLPPAMRETFVFNAPTWVDEMNEPESVMSVDLARLAAFKRPTMLTEGDQSPPFFGAILEKLATVLPHAQHHVYHGAGHVPHLTHANEFVNVVSGFVNSVTDRL